MREEGDKGGLKHRVFGHRKNASRDDGSDGHRSSPPSTPQNLSLLPYPPEVPSEVEAQVAQLHSLAYAFAFGAFVLWLLVAFSRGTVRSFLSRSLVVSACGGGACYLAWGAARSLEKEARWVRWKMHKERGGAFSPPYPETVEWLNAIIESFWLQLNPGLFDTVVDMVEDIMQASLPQFVDAVKISDVGQGRHPIRITAIRPLPDRTEDEGGDKSEKQKLVESAAHAGVADGAKHECRYINLEVAFAYRAAVKHGVHESSRERNLHLFMQFYLGLAGWAQIPLPVWVQIEEIVGTMRVRLQLTQKFPFVRDLTYSFMGVPGFRVSAIPMTKALPNVLNLPLISSFVRNAIAAGTAEFTAPKSMTLNMTDILGDAAIGDTRAAGVFLITIHRAEDLSAQDKSGSSDPYIVFSYSKFGRPEYTTRVILQDLNPVWEETFPVLLTSEEIKNEENLLLMLWDKDRLTKDDLIGRIKIPVLDLIKRPGEKQTRTDAVKGFEKGGVSQGDLHWSVTYYPKIPLNPELERPLTLADVTPSKTLPEMEMRPDDAAPNPAAKDTPPPPASPLRTPPDPRWKSGILSVVVHGLEEDTDDLGEIDLPSPMAEILYNDQLLYQTRTKVRCRDCVIEAGTEKFVRNWNTAVVKVVVRSSTLRERDPILGIVNLPLKDVLSEACEVTRRYPLERGVGYGFANISLLFRTVGVDLPPETQGWETGVCVLTSPLSIDLEPGHEDVLDGLRKIVLTTADATHTLKKSRAEIQDGGRRAVWDEKPIKLPVYFRQQAVLTFEFNGLHALHSNLDALSALWLHELVDNDEREIKLPIYQSSDLKQLKQNYINDFTRKTHDVKVVGTLTTRIVFRPGLGPSHYSSPANGPSGSMGRRHALEAWDTYEGQALLARRKADAEQSEEGIDPQLKRDLKRASTRQKKHHQQGRFEIPAYRTLLWAANGVRERVTPHRTTYKRQPVVLSERNLA